MSPEARVEANEIIITGPTLEPFVDPCRVCCAKCGSHVPLWMNLLRDAVGLSRMTAIQIAWCPGGKPPSERRNGLEAVVMGGEREFSCAGVHQPHLHCHCGRCGFAWHMATRS